MTYKGSNWTRGELGHGPPDPSTITVDCAEPTCTETTTADKLPGEWQADNHPESIVLCPTCKARTPDRFNTPSEINKRDNQSITDYMGAME